MIIKADACKQFFLDSLTNGHQLIRKIHKEYKIPIIDDEDEEWSKSKILIPSIHKEF